MPPPRSLSRSKIVTAKLPITYTLVSKVQRHKGGCSARGKKFGIIISEFNEFLTSRLLEGALDTLLRHGAREKDIHVVYVPGAFEIPLVLKKLVRKKLDAVITLAVIIRGETKHFDQVAMETARGIREISLQSEIPVILGIIPAESVEQAIHRVGLKQLNKGREWALSAIEMANLLPLKLPGRELLLTAPAWPAGRRRPGQRNALCSPARKRS